MSKKISPANTRLGLSQWWLKNFQLYGKNFFLFNKYYYKYLQLFNFIKKFLYLKRNFLININCWVFKSLIFINLHLVNLNNNFSKLFQKKIYDFLKHLIKLHFSKLRFYFWKNTEKFSSCLFLYFYIDYLSIKLKYTAKKIITFLLYYFTNQLYNNKIALSKFGPKKTFLKGFKVQLKGRFDFSKTNMSKLIVFKIGKIATTNFNTKIDFLNKPVYTKSGIYNLKLWIFHQIIE